MKGRESRIEDRGWIDRQSSIFDHRGWETMGSGVLITGTDTGVGKTFFACGLAALLKESGYEVGVMKPVETGCSQDDGKLAPQDALALKEASGCVVSLERICPYQLREPLAPSVAAEREGTRIDINRLMSVYNEINSS